MKEPSLLEAPYRGIEPFRYVDHAIFFERLEETQKLLRLMTIHRGVLVYGGTGVGKSSLINAGLISVAGDEGFCPERLRVRLHESEPLVLERISLSADGTSPYLPSALVDAKDEQENVVLSLNDLRRKLEHLPADVRPVLMFDQFEEVVTLFEEAPGKMARKDALRLQEEIFQLIGDLLSDHTLPVKLLLIFREDYLAKLNKLLAMSPELTNRCLRLVPPHTSAAYQIIRGPFKKYSWPTGSVIPPELARAVADQITLESENNVLNLSELQIACLKLWQSEDPTKVFNEKGVQGLLESYLSEALKQIGDELTDPAIVLLSRMVTESGARLVISEQDLLGFVKEKEKKIPGSLFEDALRALERTKLVRREIQREVDYVEIASEFLVPWIMTKKVERTERIKAARLAQEAEQRELAARRLADSERQRREAAERRKKRTAYLMAIACLAIALIAGLIAALIVKDRTAQALISDQVKKAEREKHEAVSRAQQERYDFELQRDKANHARDEASLAQKAAEARTTEVIQAMRSMNPKLSQSLSNVDSIANVIELLKGSNDPLARARFAEDAAPTIATLKTTLQQLKRSANQFPVPQPTP